MSTRYLIINADDYGSCHSANAAIEDLFNKGGITSTTLMTTCPWATDALLRAKANPKMRVGLHLTTTSEWDRYRWAAVSRSGVDSLYDSEGFLYRDCQGFLANAKPEEVVTEMKAQLDWMVSRGLTPTHADNHMGSLYGLAGRSYMGEVIQLLAANGLRAFRFPRSIDASAIYGNIPQEQLDQLKMLIQAMDNAGIDTITALLAHHLPVLEGDKYETFRQQYIDIALSAPQGVSEIYMHPAKDSDELRDIARDWRKRVWEYRILQDDVFFAAIASADIKLVGWTDAPFAQCK